jgi:outer membrane protein assembly factor BamD
MAQQRAAEKHIFNVSRGQFRLLSRVLMIAERASHMRVPKLVVLILMSLLLVASCHRGVKKEDVTETLPVDQLYVAAKAALVEGSLDKAARYYKRLIARFPFGPYTEQSQLELAYAQYKGHADDEAYSTLNRFIKTYPTQKHVDYAYYLRGVVNFSRQTGFLTRYVGQDMTQRDQGFVNQSFQDFSELITKFPDSRYALDAHQRMVYLRNNMANSQLNVAKYYLRLGAYLAAANRCRTVIENYQRTPQAGDALAIMVMSYKALGEEKLSADAERVLKQSYPNHPYFQGGHWPKRPPFWKRIVPFTNKNSTADDSTL